MFTDTARQADFPSLTGRTYLNTAAEGIPPRAVLRALAQYGQDKLLGMDGRELHKSQWDGARRQAAAAYGLQPDEVGICSCSSEAYNLAAMALGLQEEDEVVVNDLDFPAGATPWMQPDCPAEARVWRSREGALHVDDLKDLLGPKTRLVAVSLVRSLTAGFSDAPTRSTKHGVAAHIYAASSHDSSEGSSPSPTTESLVTRRSRCFAPRLHPQSERTDSSFIPRD